MEIANIRSLDALGLEKKKTVSPKKALQTGGRVWFFKSQEEAEKHPDFPLFPSYTRSRCQKNFERGAKWTMVIMTISHYMYKFPKLEDTPLNPYTSQRLLEFIPQFERALKNVQGHGQIWILRSLQELERTMLPDETKTEACEALESRADWIIINKSPYYETFSNNLGSDKPTWNYGGGQADSIH